MPPTTTYFPLPALQTQTYDYEMSSATSAALGEHVVVHALDTELSSGQFAVYSIDASTGVGTNTDSGSTPVIDDLQIIPMGLSGGYQWAAAVGLDGSDDLVAYVIRVDPATGELSNDGGAGWPTAVVLASVTASTNWWAERTADGLALASVDGTTLTLRLFTWSAPTLTLDTTGTSTVASASEALTVADYGSTVAVLTGKASTELKVHLFSGATLDDTDTLTSATLGASHSLGSGSYHESQAAASTADGGYCIATVRSGASSNDEAFVVPWALSGGAVTFGSPEELGNTDEYYWIIVDAEEGQQYLIRGRIISLG